MSIFQGLTGNGQTKEECMRACHCIQKTSDLPLKAETIKQTHKIIMNGKNILVGEYRKSPIVGYRIFPLSDTVGRLVDDALYYYYHPSDPTINPILVAANLFVEFL